MSGVEDGGVDRPTPSGWRNLVVVGGSAGAVETLRTIVGHLPPGFASPVAVVIHGATTGDHGLVGVLRHAGPLDVSVARDGEAMRPGHIYVAARDRHLLVEEGRLHLRFAAEENRARPAIDPLFRSAAISHGPRVIGVVLSGNLDDGSAGLLAIRSSGGRALVQDPDDALFPEMPSNAVRYALPHAVLPTLALAEELVRLGHHRGGGGTRTDVTETAGEAPTGPLPSDAGHVSALTCPLCHGAVWERDLGGLLQYRCRTGHVLGQETMLSAQDQMVGDALWAATRALEERSELSRRLAARFEARGETATAARHLREAAVAMRRAETLRSAVLLADAPPSRTSAATNQN